MMPPSQFIIKSRSPITLIIKKFVIRHFSNGGEKPNAIHIKSVKFFSNTLMTEKQFALWLRTNFGVGKYYIPALTKHRKGVRNFWYGEIGNNYWIRTKGSMMGYIKGLRINNYYSYF